MKRVIRKGIFETNSSSTHSLSLVKNALRNSKVEKGVSFEIRSNLAKTVFVLGLIDNAEYEFKYKWQYIDDNENCKKEQKRAINNLKECEWQQESYNKIMEKYKNLEDMSFSDFVMAMDENCIDSKVIFDEIEDYFLQEIVIDCVCYRKAVMKLKDALIKTFCELEGVSLQEGMDKLYYEEYKNTRIEKILLESKDKEKDLKEYAKDYYNYEFSRGYKNSKTKDIVEYAKKYLIDSVKKETKLQNGRFFCSRYFREGCLDECYCGFHDFKNICWHLDINWWWEDEKYIEYAKEFLTYKYKFQAIEKYCGSYFEGNGEIY